MAVSKIPNNLVPAILSKSGEGWDYSRIAAWLLTEHGIAVHDSVVARRLKKVKDERHSMAQLIVQDKLSKVLTADLDKVAGVIDRALDDEMRCRARAWGFKESVAQPFGIKEGEVAPVVGSETWARMMHSVKTSRSDLMSALELRLKLAGLDKDGKPVADDEMTRNMLLSKVDKLLEKYEPAKVQPSNLH